MDNIKIIASDLDGSLLSSLHGISKYTKDVIKKVTDMGIEFVPCTGRPLCSIPNEIKELPGIRYIIYSNGASVYDLYEDKIIFSANLSIDKAMEVYNAFKDFDVLTVLYRNGIDYISQYHYDNVYHYINDGFFSEYIKELLHPVPSLESLIQEEGYLLESINCISQNLEEMKKAYNSVKDIKDIFISPATPCDLEIGDINANKGNALKKLCKHLNIDIKDSLSFGDGMNDYTLIKESAIGVAMINGEENLKSAADIISEKSNTEDGVAHMIEKLLLK